MQSDSISSSIPKPAPNHQAAYLKQHPPYFKQSYGYVLTVTDGDAITEVKYEAEVAYLKNLQSGNHLFSIDRKSEVLINGLEPKLLAEQLAYEAGKVFYPLAIEVNAEGEFIRINNYPQIKDRWQAQKPILEEYFTGEAANQYIGLMDQAISDEKQITRALGNDMFIASYFCGIYKSYTAAFKIQDLKRFPITGHAVGAMFLTSQYLKETLNDYGAVEIEHHGVLNDDRGVDDFEQGLNFAFSRINEPDQPDTKGAYEALYILNADTNIIEAIIADWKLELTKTKNFNLKLFSVDLEPPVNQFKQPVRKGDETITIIDGLKDGRKQDANIFTKFMESLFGK